MKAMIFAALMLTTPVASEESTEGVLSLSGDLLEGMARSTYLLGAECAQQHSMEFCVKDFDRIWKETDPK